MIISIISVIIATVVFLMASFFVIRRRMRPDHYLLKNKGNWGYFKRIFQLIINKVWRKIKKYHKK
jgi:hypothetical protein